MTKRALSLFLLALTGCGGASSEEPTVRDPEPEVAVTREPADERPADPWAQLQGEALRAYVLERVRAEMPEMQADFDMAQIDAYRAAPDSAPALSGRAVERLMDLAAVELSAGRLAEAEQTVLLVRARARNRNDAFAGSTTLAEIARRRATDEAGQREAIATVLRQLPRARFGGATLVFQLFQTQEQVDANLAQLKTQLVSRETARSVLFFSQILPEIVRSRAVFLAAIDVVKAEHDAQPAAREYAFSTVDLARARDAQPVVIAVWDTGTSPTLFESQLFSNPNEQPNGQDDDENGQIDDIHGLVADGNAPNTALLYEPAAEILERHKPFLKGVMDLRAGLSSTDDAHRVLELMRSVTDATELERLEQNLDAVGEWAHGSHVAGLMLAGNPTARLAIFRSAWAGEARPYHQRGPTDEELAAERANVEAIAAFINRHHVKVVNASLGFSRDYVEDQLRYEQGRYPNDDAVRARARVVHQHRTDTWRLVFERCPETLFVVAAGNANRDVVEYEDVPASFDLPNLLVVGAVDSYGNWSTFTSSNPERVRIFDFGVAVPSVIPSGETIPLSGTSMASPNVANLAGKMFAVRPNLTPQRAIEIIVQSGEAIAAPFNGRIANERAALALTRRERR